MSEPEPVTDDELTKWARWLRDAPTAIVGTDRSLPCAIMVPRLVAALQKERRRVAELEAVIDDVVPELLQ